MHLSTQCRRRRRAAFTLVELLVVISIMAVLAALVFPVVGAVRKAYTFKRAQAELSQVQTAIEAYKAKLGFYPPDNPGHPALNQLYFELEGTVLTTSPRRMYSTLDGSSQIPGGGVPALFGPNVTAFVNSSRNAVNSDENTAAVNFLKAGLRPDQIGQMTVDNGASYFNGILVCSVPWTDPNPATAPISSPPAPRPPPTLNPWRYVSSSPTNNPGSYDLWADIYFRGKVYRVSNWNSKPQVVP
jgi:prepilin-type N-terminal cleavage/methylation domain-containing protein